MKFNKGIVLLSGGLDSSTALALATKECKQLVALNMFYGQRHQVEIQSAKDVAQHYFVQLVEIDVSQAFRNFKSSLLPLSGIEVDDNQDKNSVGATYVPARNSILLSIAAGFADTVGAEVVYYGAHAEDHAGYPDCRPEYFNAINAALQLGTKNAVQIRAPFINVSKSEIVKIGSALDVPYEKTHSCYRGFKPACGTCPTCELRINAFAAAELVDPIPYAIGINWSGEIK